MMSATVSVWVPLAVAGVGLVSTFGAWFLTRWADRRDRREQWQRDNSLRWQQDRQHAYAGLIAALDEWNREFSPVVATFKVDARLNTSTDVDADALTRLGRAANEEAALVGLMAPEAVSELAESTIRDRRQFRTSLALRIAGAKLDNPSDFTELDTRLDHLFKKTDRMREVMRTTWASRATPGTWCSEKASYRGVPAPAHRSASYIAAVCTHRALGYLPDEPRAVPASPRAIT